MRRKGQTEQAAETTGQTATKRGGARTRILDAALCLFNDNGTANVSTNHIAEAAELSVGNLYYHFKNKEEIILALHRQQTDDSDAAFAVAPGDAFGIEIMERMLRANFGIIWRYRFFYRELVALLNHDPALAAHYRASQRRGFDDFTQLMRAFAEGGVLRPLPDPEELNALAQTCWLVSEFYPLFAEAQGLASSEAAWQEQGTAILRRVLQPYRLS